VRNVEIQVFQIASSKIEHGPLRDWLDSIGADEYDVPPSEEVGDAELLVGMAAKRCYMSFMEGLNPNITKVRKDWVEYIDNVLAAGHGSVFEHATYSYAIENVSRVFTGEMNRHRAGMAISEGSMRFIRFTDIPYWVPFSIRPTMEPCPTCDVPLGVRALKCEACGAMINKSFTEEDKEALLLEEKKDRSREIFEEVFSFCELKYGELVKIWDMDKPEVKFSQKKQITSCIRRIIPIGVATGGIWTFNLRALRHILAIRSTAHAEEEIAHVMSLIGADIGKKEPKIFGDFKQDEDGFWKPEYQKV